MRWFQRVGRVFWPVSIPGGVACLAAAVFCVSVFPAIDRHSHSSSDTLYGVFPYFACSTVLLDLLARNNSLQHGDAS